MLPHGLDWLELATARAPCGGTRLRLLAARGRQLLSGQTHHDTNCGAAERYRSKEDCSVSPSQARSSLWHLPEGPCRAAGRDIRSDAKGYLCTLVILVSA